VVIALLAPRLQWRDRAGLTPTSLFSSYRGTCSYWIF